MCLVHAKQSTAPTTAKAGDSLRKRLRLFTSLVRPVVSCFLAEEERVHFTPAIKRESRLQMLGIHNHTQAIRFLPVVSHATGKAIAKVVLSLMGKFITLQRMLHSEGKLPLKLKRVKFKPAPKWHNLLRGVPTDFHWHAALGQAANGEMIGTRGGRARSVLAYPMPAMRLR